MSTTESPEELQNRIKELELRLEEAQDAIEAIKNGHVDAFAVRSDGKMEVYTLQSLDYLYRVLIEKFSEGAVNLSEDGAIVYSNRSFADLVCVPHEKLLGMPISRFIPEGSKKSFESLFARAFKGGSKGEIVLLADNREIPVSLSLISLTPHLASVGIIVTDLTQKKRQERLEESNMRLEQRVKERTAELEMSNRELESFSYSVAHDLRAPIRAINGFTQVIENKYNPLFDDEGRKLLHIISREALRMGKLIDDLLAFSRLGRKEVDKSHVDMTELVHEAIDAVLGPHDAEGRAAIVVYELPPAFCDRTLVEQVFINLLSNAVKYSRPKSQPRIEVGAYTEGETTVYFVKDNGIGFEMEYHDKLFDMFQRLHAKEEFEGTGIGLAMVKRTATRHGGKVWAEGKIDEGATFYFSLPAVKEVL